MKAICISCDEEKELNLDNFEQHTNTKKKIVFRKKCRVCRGKVHALWKINNKPRDREHQRAWRLANPLISKIAEKTNCANRRARQYSAPGKVTVQQVLKLFQDYYVLCGYCCESATTLDHIAPVSRGGSGYIENLIPACATCNTQKNSNILGVEWFAPIDIDIRFPEFHKIHPRKKFEYRNNETSRASVLQQCRI